MTSEDRQLRSLLRQWPGMDIPPALEDTVWRRIRQDPSPRTLDGWQVLLGGLPAWRLAAAVAAAALLGTAAAFTLPKPAAPVDGASILGARTLSGTYLSALGGPR